MALATPGLPGNVRSWDTVQVHLAPVGSTLPTTVSAALDAAFFEIGLMSDDQLTETWDVDRNELRSLGGNLVRVKRTAQTVQFGFTALENSHKVFLTAYPGSTATTATGVTTRVVNKMTTVQQALVIHAVEGTNIMRTVVSTCEVFADGDRVMGPSDMWQIPMTAIVYPTSPGSFYTQITNDAAASAT